MSEEIISPRMQRLRDAGYKLTHARITVLNALERGGGHMTSTELLDQVEALDSSIGRASVFRALDLFTRLSLVRPTYIDSSVTPTYVLMPDGHHHHIICTQCSRVIEFEDCSLGALTHTLEERLGVRLTGHLLEFYGLCSTCKDQPVREE
ncbi:MAG: transcriptional repressor [Chloroflexi bacterium]|uniref:Fur family transcriptional regulator n=1 Tax=Candidatus Flexifilum breve TaxID=3140694 RepID=UPI0031360383|nr:transcriptional repressor [Chloroflexota bacterium]